MASHHYLVLTSASQHYLVLTSASQHYPVLTSASQHYPVLTSASQHYVVLMSASQHYLVLTRAPCAVCCGLCGLCSPGARGQLSGLYTGPYFSRYTPANVTVTAGSTATLPCRVHQVQRTTNPREYS